MNMMFCDGMFRERALELAAFQRFLEGNPVPAGFADLQWYVARVRPAARPPSLPSGDVMAAVELQAMGVPFLLPHLCEAMRARGRGRGRRRSAMRLMLPGYLLVAWKPGLALDCLSGCRHISGLMGMEGPFGVIPERVPVREVKRLVSAMIKGRDTVVANRRLPVKGRSYEIEGTVFDGAKLEFSRMRRAGTAEMIAEMLGCRRPVEVPLDSLVIS